jgi:hypothetical protein
LPQRLHEVKPNPALAAKPNACCATLSPSFLGQQFGREPIAVANHQRRRIMAHTEIAPQIVVEHTMLKCLMDSLRATMAWTIQGQDIARKLSTLRFIAQSLQRHLQHLLALEEYDGYLNPVMENCPQMGKTVDALRTEHQSFRHDVGRLVHRLEQIASTDYAGFTALCVELQALLDRLDDHNRKETDLVQEALERDGGGEG